MKTLSLIAALALSATAAADSITMRHAVRIAAGADAVRLSDIATLEGVEAEALADVVIVETPPRDEIVEISLAEVRETLTEAGVHWGRVHLSGRKTVVRPRFAAGSAAPEAMKPIAIEGRNTVTSPKKNTPTRRDRVVSSAETLMAAPTLRGIVARRIVDGLGARPNDVRLAFAPADAALLDEQPSAVRIEIESVSRFRSDRVELVIRFWENGRVIRRESIGVELSLRTPTAILTSDIDRGTTVLDEHLAPSEAWLAPSQADRAAGLIHSVGRVTTKQLRAGDVLRTSDLDRETLVERGDTVMVRCPVEGLVITLEAQARADGALGEEIAFRKKGERQDFTATITGRGEAVLQLD